MTDVERMCTSKKRYPSRRAAIRAALRLARIAPHRPYRCPICGGWHCTVHHAITVPKELP